MNRLLMIVPASSRRRRRIRLAVPLALIVFLAGSGRALNAQGQTPTLPGDTQAPSSLARPRLVDVSRRLFAVEELVGGARPAQRGSSRDTLVNGALIGAVAGAVGLGAVGGLICRLYQEDGDPSCWSDTLRLAAIGAAIGAGAGITVDAALTRHAGVAVRVGVRF